MGPESQNILIKTPEQPEVVEREVRAAVRLRTVDRDQTLLVQIWVDELIAADQARAIWELAGQLDLSKFKEPLKSRQGGAGRAAWDPRLLVSLWVYAYSEGVSSARERKERLDAAMDEWKKMAEGCTEKQKEDLRVSMTEPEARRMKHGDNAITPGYNAQISTDAQNKIIVGAHLSQSGSDAQSPMPAIEEVKDNLNREPVQMVVDGGFTNRDNIRACAEKKIDLVGSMADPVERSEASMKAAGIDRAFAPHHFRILPESK